MAEELILEVIDGPVETNMVGHKKVFAKSGGSIGRADSNSWVLPDVERIVSSVHADIVFSGDSYFVFDKSTNGTFINGSDDSLGSGNKAQLNDGDIISVGHYQIKSTLKVFDNKLPDGLGSVDFLDSSDKTTIGSLAMQPEPNKPDAGAQFDDWLEPGKEQSASQNIWGAIDSAPPSAAIDPLAAPSSFDSLGGGQDILDPLAALSGSAPEFQSPQADPWSGNQNTADDWWASDSSDHVPAEQQSMVVPQAQPAQQPFQPSPSAPQPVVNPQPVVQQSVPVQPAAAQPEVARSLDSMSLDELLAPGAEVAPAPQALQPAVAPPPVAPPPVAPPSQPVAPVQGQQVAVAGSATLARELGVENVDAASLQNLESEAGAFIRETSTRLIDLLRARSIIKNELRVERTMIQSQDNNPLKFSASAHDALGMMFGGNSNAFLSPSEAVRDSFDNISDHQVAVLAAMRSAFEFMLSQFAPENLEARFNCNQNKGFMSNKKAKNWESYQDWLNDLRKDPEKTYNQMFGEVFAEAYEKKIAELNAVRNI
ncbi:type VI secretion system-associated FHA domain protein TagH [Parendozoicomonas sp. Alg238-R29]|uniref:type VI secretion system-associated FHA domain protein TagH n=1 Tax=Parendozoicomonas sp. Alg238-R29 TaxID=2993446 RepID=UPI00248E8F27|nr:type VI secretion system-associated FHA domain protein TagH [Parendozoicomonas sp. Alg238-R29]